MNISSNISLFFMVIFMFRVLWAEVCNGFTLRLEKGCRKTDDHVVGWAFISSLPGNPKTMGSQWPATSCHSTRLYLIWLFWLSAHLTCTSTHLIVVQLAIELASELIAGSDSYTVCVA